MGEDRFRNQRRMLDTDKLAGLSFAVIGSGAIGSFFVSTLTKMGAKKITVYDNDRIEDHNIANQLFPVKYVGQPKVNALRQVANEYGEVLIEIKDMRWHPDNAIDADVIVAAVDNMDVRKALWDHYSAKPCRFFLDGRMAAQVWRVYGVDMNIADAKEFYGKTLYPQSEAEPERCGHKSIIYTVLGVSSEMLAQVKRWIQEEYRPTEVMFDALNCDIIKKYHMKPNYEVIEAPDEPEEVAA